MPHDLKRHCRERDADAQLGQADPAARHQADVARGREYAAAGDRVAVDGGHHRARAVEDGQERLG